ncbi:MAG: lytic transglycosylase domain-containing protein [Verrucomicrobia bacterium]|nr:lytic transglycosylase domain-containing protein [Verrucomicrobiota bacterium]
MRRIFIFLSLSLAVVGRAADPAPAPPVQPSPAPAQPPPPSTDELYEAGKALFDEFAPPEVKEEYEFPSKVQWDEFAARLQHALDNNDLQALAAYEPEARAALVALRAMPGYEDYADWLAERIDYMEAAKQTAALPAPQPPKPGQPKPPAAAVSIPYYDLWVKRVQARPLPARADELMPVLRAAFIAEGVPAELAWLAEAESTLNPGARSPAGAKGLFQLMPDTAKNLGLSTWLPDERSDAEKSARAAARYLRTLRAKFGEWPLAFAAYNAGEGRVRRLLASKQATTFAQISASLPSETRMYVPKVCATVAVRSGVTPDKLPAPRA